MPSVDESLSRIGRAKYFSPIEADSGFWQIPLDERFTKLTSPILIECDLQFHLLQNTFRRGL